MPVLTLKSGVPWVGVPTWCNMTGPGWGGFGGSGTAGAGEDGCGLDCDVGGGACTWGCGALPRFILSSRSNSLMVFVAGAAGFVGADIAGIGADVAGVVVGADAAVPLGVGTLGVITPSLTTGFCDACLDHPLSEREFVCCGNVIDGDAILFGAGATGGLGAVGTGGAGGFGGVPVTFTAGVAFGCASKFCERIFGPATAAAPTAAPTTIPPAAAAPATRLLVAVLAVETA